MTFDDERKQIGDLVVAFVRKIDFGRDLEKQLNMYVDCRQAFTSLDKVTSELVLRVIKLANRANVFMKGKHTRKTSAFVKACLAYCHITIPSLDDAIPRLHLLLQCGEVALVNQMIVQGEAFLKAAISLIPEVPPKTGTSVFLAKLDKLAHGNAKSHNPCKQPKSRNNFFFFLLLSRIPNNEENLFDGA